MPYSEMTREQLLDEIERLNQRIGELEANSVPNHELLSRELKFRHFMDNSPVIAWMKDDHGRYVYLNGVYEKRLNLRLHDWLYKTDHEVWPKEIADRFRENDQEVLRTGVITELIEETIDSEGQKSSWLNIKFPFTDHSGKRHVGGIGIDVKAEGLSKALRESENKFATAFRNSPVAMCITSATSGAYTEVNDVFLKDTGYALDEIIGHTSEELGLFVNSADRDRLVSLVVEHGHAYDEAISFRMKSGKQLICSVSTNFITLGGKPHFLSSILDVTMLKEAMAALAESEERFRLAIATSPDAICITRESDGFYIEVNDAFSKMTGYSRQEITGNTSSQVNVWKDPKDRDQFLELLKNDGSTHDQQFIFRRRDGSFFWGSVSASVMTYRDERHVISITRDITDRTEAELEKQKLQDQIFESRKMESLGTLVGGIAHDFNNMLQIIIGYSEILMDGIGPDKILQHQLQTIIRTSRDGAELVNKLLAFVQQAQVFPRPVDLNSQIRNVIKFLSRTLPKKVKINFSLSNEPPNIQADPKQLEQILVNLALNASEAMPEGGSLNISTCRVTREADDLVNHPGTKAGDYFLMTVEDSGHGMNNETISKIFDPFFSTKQKGSTRGTGLGLSVVLGIVQQHGWLIECHSEPGVGTRFDIYFPVIGNPESVGPEHSRKSRSRPDTSILIVEDVPSIVDMEKTIFEAAGYRVFSATNGHEALEIYLANKEQISLVVLDLVMPVMSGKECLMELLKIDPSLKVIIVSGYSRKEEVSQQVLPYVKGFLTKPCSKAELLKAVRSALNG